MLCPAASVTAMMSLPSLMTITPAKGRCVSPSRTLTITLGPATATAATAHSTINLGTLTIF